MIYLYTFLIIALSSVLWRVRGGLDIWKGDDVPMNKIWYAVAFSLYACYYFGFNFEIATVGFITAYCSYQLYGWGLYVGRLLVSAPLDPEKDRECELIDELLYPLHISMKGTKYYLYQYPRLFGFLGTCLTGLIITFLWGLFLCDLRIMVSGLGMGLCYYLGSLVCKLKDDGKFGWNWGEIFAGMWFGFILAMELL